MLMRVGMIPTIKGKGQKAAILNIKLIYHVPQMMHGLKCKSYKIQLGRISIYYVCVK